MMIVATSAASLVQPKVNAASLKAAPVSQAFGLKTASSKVSCSLEENVRGFVQKAADAGKTAALALASTALLASAAQAEIPRLTFEELQSLTYSEVKGSGIANQCPIIAGGVDGFAFKSGKYQVTKMCLEPTSFTVKAESQFKGQGEDFQKTKLMTRLTYTLDEIEGPLEVSGDKIKFTEVDGIDYAAVTVQLSGGERVPFLFTIKELVASGTPDSFGGSFLVPSYRGATFLDPKGRGGAQGYDSAVALPAGGFGDNEKLRKENEKSYKSLSGNITFSVAKSNVETGEIGGVFTSVQPSDTDMGAKVPKEVKIQGIWYAQDLSATWRSLYPPITRPSAPLLSLLSRSLPVWPPPNRLYATTSRTSLPLNHLNLNKAFLKLRLSAMASLLASSFLVSTPAASLGSCATLTESSSQVSCAAPVNQDALKVAGFPQVYCGRGDKRTAKGKRTRGSFGNSSKGKSRLGLPLTPVPAGSGSRKRLEDDTEYIHIDLDEEINR
ncbi:unnamed protein product [Closterium sp. Yama58-4]|nr:unnamed protein product [Closterium sp. Yama58-4]